MQFDRIKSGLWACVGAGALLFTVGIVSISGCGSANNTYGAVHNSPDFSVLISVVNQPNSVAPPSNSVTVSQGAIAHLSVTVVALNGFANPVSLSTSGIATGASAVLGKATITPSAAGVSTTLDVSVGAPNAATPTPPGTYSVALVASSGGVTHSVSATVIVTASVDFSVAITEATPGSGTIALGNTARYIATVTGYNGFSSPVSLTPGGIPAFGTAHLGATTITPTAAGASTTLEIATVAASGALAGTYPVTLTGSAGPTTHTVTTNLGIFIPLSDFNVTITPPSIQSGGGYSDYTMVLSSLNGFSAPVTFAVSGLPANTTTSFYPDTVSPTASGASVTFEIVANFPGRTHQGTYPFTVTCTSGTITHTVSATWTYQALN